MLLKYRRRQLANDIPPSDRSIEGFFVRPDYRARLAPEYFEDLVPGSGLVYQPDVYSLAECLASPVAKRVIDIGCGKGEKLKAFADGFKVTGIDVGVNIEYCQRTYAFGRWIVHDLQSDNPFPLRPSDFTDSVVICADVIEHIVDPVPLLRNLKDSVDHGALVVISTPERDFVRGRGDRGPPANRAHAREWNLGEFRALLLHAGFDIPFLGLTANNSLERQMSTIVAIVRAQRAARPCGPCAARP